MTFNLKYNSGFINPEFLKKISNTIYSGFKTRNHNLLQLHLPPHTLFSLTWLSPSTKPLDRILFPNSTHNRRPKLSMHHLHRPTLDSNYRWILVFRPESYSQKGTSHIHKNHFRKVLSFSNFDVHSSTYEFSKFYHFW